MKFKVGQVIRHRMFHYRGVIFAADKFFKGTDKWYEIVAKSKPPKNKPWYKVLVDGDEQTTYVAERNLENDDSGEPVNHPMLLLNFDTFEDGRYLMKSLN